MTNDPGKSPRFVVSISEMLVLVAMASGFIGILLPAMDAARDSQGLPVKFPLIYSLRDFHPLLFPIGFPVATTALAVSFIVFMRAQLPRSIRAYFQWNRRPKIRSPEPEPILDSRPAIAAFTAACSGAVVLIIAALHVRVDRTYRRPIVTWEGPLADYVQYMAYLGWFLSVLAIVGGIYAALRFKSKFTTMEIMTPGFGFVNFFLSFLFYAAVYED